MGADYERELKRLLEGDLETLRKMMRTCDAFECVGYRTVERYPFMVIRGAGSFGVDLVAIRGEMAFPIEVKSSIHPRVYLNNPRLKEQLATYTGECGRANTLPLYALRMKGMVSNKGDPWRIFTVKVEGLKYFSRLLNSKVPSLKPTAGGNYLLDFAVGMPLSAFLLEISKMLSSVK